MAAKGKARVTGPAGEFRKFGKGGGGGGGATFHNPNTKGKTRTGGGGKKGA